MNQDQSGGQLPYAPTPQPSQPVIGGSPESTPASSSTKHDPYAFIREADHTPPKSKFASSQTSKILVVLLGLVLLAVIAAVVMSLLTPKDSATTLATSLASEQYQLVRIADQGSQSGTTQSIRDTAITISTSLANDQASTNSYLALNKIKLDPKVLAAGNDAKIDQLLSDARASSTFDTVWKETMSQQLTIYQSNVKTLYSKTGNKAFKDSLVTSFDSNKLLLELLAKD